MYFESVSILDRLSWGEHAVRTAAHCTFVKCVCCLVFSQFRNWILFSLHIQSALFESSFSQCIDSCVSLFFYSHPFSCLHQISGEHFLWLCFSTFILNQVYCYTNSIAMIYYTEEMLRSRRRKFGDEWRKTHSKGFCLLCVGKIGLFTCISFDLANLSLACLGSHTPHMQRTLKRAGVERDCLKAPSLFFGLSKQTSQSLNEWTIYLFTLDDNFWKLFCQLSRRFLVWFGLLSYAVCFLFE